MGKRGPKPGPAVAPTELVLRYQAGELTGSEAARLLGVCRETALRRLRAAGVDTAQRRGGRSRQLAIEPDVLIRYAAGELDHNDVGRLYGVGPMVALRELRRAGADTSRGTRKRLQSARRRGVPGLHTEVVRLYCEGNSLRQVGRFLGLTAQGVHDILRRSGVPRRPAGGRVRPAAGEG